MNPNYHATLRQRLAEIDQQVAELGRERALVAQILELATKDPGPPQDPALPGDVISTRHPSLAHLAPGGNRHIIARIPAALAALGDSFTREDMVKWFQVKGSSAAGPRARGVAFGTAENYTSTVLSYLRRTDHIAELAQNQFQVIR